MFTRSLFVLLALSFLSLLTCPSEAVERVKFQKTIGGKQTDLYFLKNAGGIEVAITNYGGRIVSILAPDRNGKVADIALGYGSLDEHIKDSMHVGGIIGRFANRIANGKFTLDSKTFSLAQNNGPNSLHGGLKGFDGVVWDAKQDGNRLTLSYVSADKEEGYPGTMKVRALYSLESENVLRVEIEATTDQTTVVNLTNHAYYNLKGEGSGDILSHVLEIKSDRILELNQFSSPTGKILEVKGTPFDFNKLTKVGQRIDSSHAQLKVGRGYDHAWLLAGSKDTPLFAARLVDQVSGRAMEISTNEPSIQIYTGNFMDGSTKGKSGKPYLFRNGIALEPEHYPDSPNHPEFPSTVLRPGETFKHITFYRFYVDKKEKK